MFDLPPHHFRERVVRINLMAAVHNKDILLAKRQNFYDLECGHVALGKMGSKFINCLRCREMMVRSLTVPDDAPQEDYDGFRNLKTWQDKMIWRDDPCRFLNEETDLAGNYINDPEWIPYDRR